MQHYFWAESILDSMIDSTLNGNFLPVFILNRPLLEACCKGVRICVCSKVTEGDMHLPDLAEEIDAAVQDKFEWNAPFSNKPVANPFSGFIKSSILKTLSDAGTVKPTP